MTAPLATLAAILTQENAALAVLDTDAAAALLPAKQQAAEALAALHPTQADLAALAPLAAENRRLLERAITAQHSVIGLIARAARATPAAAPRYGAAGRLVAPTAAPVAIAASA